MNEIVYFGTFDADGWPTGFFPSDVWLTPPEGAVEITELQWRALLQGGTKFIDGEVVKSDEPRPLEVPDA
jgi:hypothetical protein